MKNLILLFCFFTELAMAQSSLCQFTTLNATAINMSTGQPFDTSQVFLSWTSDLPGWNDPGSVSHWSQFMTSSGSYSIGLNEATAYCDMSVFYSITVLPAVVSLNPAPICLSSGDESVPANGASVSGGQYFIEGIARQYFSLSDIGLTVTYVVTLSNGCTATATAVLIGSQVDIPSILIGN